MQQQLIRDVLEAWLGKTVLPIVIDQLAIAIDESLVAGTPATQQ